MNKISTHCPLGHHVQGNASLLGTWVHCPVCQAGFEFALPTNANDSAATEADHRSVTDTGIMRILGPYEPPSASQPKNEPANSEAPEPESDVVLQYKPSMTATTIEAIRNAFQNQQS
ncbi:hypothetical protein [Rubripirellula amarantea]|uniref:hypothetical protein n=1 Tax=Rubripirellula amarantea TaxID=2527999 RepID=UPI0011B56236|nr:hypothetical protein [Rubripirellula amarantea]